MAPRSRRGVRRATAWLLIGALQAAPPGIAFAAPEGEDVVSGQADFERTGDLTRITTHTPQTIIRYTGFDQYGDAIDRTVEAGIVLGYTHMDAAWIQRACGVLAEVVRGCAGGLNGRK